MRIIVLLLSCMIIAAYANTRQYSKKCPWKVAVGRVVGGPWITNLYGTYFEEPGTVNGYAHYTSSDKKNAIWYDIKNKK